MRKSTPYILYLQYCVYIKSIKLYSKSTIDIYDNNIDEFLTFLKRNKKLDLRYIDKNIVELYLQTFSGKYSIQMINLKIASLNSFFGFLRNKFNFMSFPRLSYLKNNRKEINVISQEKLLNFLQKSDPKIVKEISWIYYRNFAMGYLIYSTGMRISEVINLKTNFLYRENWIFIENSKNGKTRIVPVADEALKYIDLYKQKCPYYFKSFLWFSNKGKKLSAGTAKTAIKSLFGVYPHYLRHAYATHLIENGCDIKVLQELLGHSSLETTKIYISVSYKMLIDTVKKHPLYSIEKI